MKLLLILASLGLLAGVGCGNSNTSSGSAKTNSPPTRAASSGNPITAPVDYLGAVGRAKQVAGKQVDLATMNRAIQSFQAGEGRYPTDLNEIVTEKYMPKIPELPRGLHYQYDPRTGALQITR